jgi:hypothetical protein
MVELEEEILLRFPPHEPALLFRASLVCKHWRRLISGPRFRRRYHEFHRTPPMLGFLCSIADDPDDAMAGFVATATFCSPDADLGDCSPLDARRGNSKFGTPNIALCGFAISNIDFAKLGLKTLSSFKPCH